MRSIHRTYPVTFESKSHKTTGWFEWNLIGWRWTMSPFSGSDTVNAPLAIGHGTKFLLGLDPSGKTIRIYSESLFFFRLSPANHFRKAEEKRRNETRKRTKDGKTKMRSLQCFWFLSQIGWHLETMAQHHSIEMIFSVTTNTAVSTPKLFKVWNSLGDLDKSVTCS